MKLRKQSKLKAVILAAVAGLMVGFLGLVKAQPGIDAEAETSPSPTPDYDRVFTPDSAATPAGVPVDRPPTHTRSRAS